MREVIEERKRQIKRKEQVFAMNKEEEMLERERLIAEMERLATIEEQQAFDRAEGRRKNQEVVISQIKRKEQAQREDAEQIEAERWLQAKSEEEYRRRVEAEREAFAREREAIVLERKKGTGVIPSATGPGDTVKHGRRAGSASSQRSTEPP